MTIWTMRGRGWHTSELGGVLREQDGWYFYSKDDDAPAGPFKTKEAAMEAAGILTGTALLPSDLQ
jgi:hypothetical protein